jgi:membrane-bound inhibitor of C-type lysozyme
MRAVVAILALLALAACHEQKPAPLRAPEASGSVNPDPGVTTYVCLDGQRITAGYPDPRTAVITYKDHAYTLKLAPAADGARYTGYGLQWWTHGRHASIAALKGGEEIAADPGLDCTAEGSAPAATFTHTSFSEGDGPR